jgi:small-conductance mechanosensitive channel
VQYLSRPFVVGDKIDVMTSSGSKVVSGFVEEVSPMRTHLRTDHWLSVMVPNKVHLPCAMLACPTSLPPLLFSSGT